MTVHLCLKRKTAETKGGRPYDGLDVSKPQAVSATNYLDRPCHLHRKAFWNAEHGKLGPLVALAFAVILTDVSGRWYVLCKKSLSWIHSKLRASL